MERLNGAAQVGDIDLLYEIIQQDTMILERIDQEPFTNSPLHIAASFGSTHFCLELMRLKPSFGTKLNPDGYTPLHLALNKGHTATVKRLTDLYPHLIRVQGRKGITLLHRVAELDETDLLADFLVACPASINDLTIRRETAVHVAVKKERLRALEVLFGWLDRSDNKEILNWKDEEGNAIIHLAVSTNQTEILKFLIGKAELNVKNTEGFTAKDIAENFPKQQNASIRNILKHAGARKASLSANNKLTLADALSRRPRLFSKLVMKIDTYLDVGLSGDIRNALLVVAVLIATATYQAVLQPPGGVTEPDNPPPPLILNATFTNTSSTITNTNTTLNGIIYGSEVEENDGGKVVMEKPFFYVFLYLNSIPFAISVGMILLLLPRDGHNALFYICLTFLLLNYLVSQMVIAPFNVVNSINITFVATHIIWFLFLATRRAQMKPTGRIGKLLRSIIQNENVEILRQVYVSRYSKQSGG